jgi:hypothetical protein
MPRAIRLFVTIVAAIELPLAAATPSFTDAPVAAPAMAAAEMLGLDAARDRSRFLAELTRLLYTPPEGKSPAIALLANSRRPAASGGAAPRVPVPLSSEIWSRAVFRRPVADDDLVRAILADRRAALIAHALTALDAETLQFLAAEPSILTALYERGAAPFAAFGASLVIAAGRVATPGGEASAPLWEAVVGAPASRPALFVAALYGAEGGRLAYLYDTIAHLEPPAAAFALGSWIADPVARSEQFQRLAAACTGLYAEWRVETLPFSRPMNDLALALLRVRVAPGGAPMTPSSREFWRAALGSGDLSPLAQAPPGDAADPIDAAWLATTLGSGDMYERGARLEQFSFGARVFGRARAGGWSDAVTAIRAFPRYRMLMLGLERMGFAEPSLYAHAARQASRIGGPPSRVFWMHAQLQGALALAAHLVRVETLDAAAAGSVIRSLLAVPFESDRYHGGIADWLESQLLPRLPGAPSDEARMLAALAGPASRGAARRVAWEGQEYRLDFAAAERRRLEIVRRKQSGATIDAALAVRRAARALAALAAGGGGADRMIAELEALAAGLPPAVGGGAADLYAPGVDPPRPAAAIVAEAAADVAASRRDPRRAARQAAALTDTADTMLGEALISIVYAASIGDPQGPPMLTRNVALRHDFGFVHGNVSVRERIRWEMPRPYFQPGTPWHVTGSLLGLDLALAPQVLRRIAGNGLAQAPRLPSHQREAFAASVVLMDPARLRDEDVAAMAAAVDAGVARVRAAQRDAAALDAVARELALDGWRRQALQLASGGGSSDVAAAFTLVELLRLGGGAAGADLDAWGLSALPIDGCVCSRLVAPRQWRLLLGRPQSTLMAAAVPDLNLHVALTLHAMGLPAPLAVPVLAAAVQDFVDEVAPSDFNDWWTLAASARTVTRTRIEDYVAAAAAVDGPLVPLDAAETDEGAR